MVRSGFVLCGAVLLFLLLAASSSSSSAARPDTTALPISSQSLPQVVEEESDSKVQVVGMEERCDDGDEDECLMRRTLVAHIDYIYTQNHKH